jgi:penicillin-binding protein-related factor A (putative recombinase)
MQLTQPTEKQIQNSILVMLRHYKIFCWQNDSVGIFDAKKGVYRKNNSSFYIKGVSDILGILPDGKLLAIEVKTPQRIKNTTEHQERFIKEINLNNGIAFVATSVNQTKECLEKYGYITKR